MSDQLALSVYVRIGDGPEHHVGDIDHPDALPDLLRHAARYMAEIRAGRTPDTAQET